MNRISLKLLLLFGCSMIVSCASLKDAEKSASNPQQNKQLHCLAEVIHGEARGEPEEGQIFVGRVVLTRVQKGYGRNYCEVAHARNQFAPKKNFTPASMTAAHKSHRLGPNGITHFHSYPYKYTKNAGFSMSPKCKYTGKVGGHWGFACLERRSISSTEK
jgi:hypothetical protein